MTGSAHCELAAYWSGRRGIMSRFSAYQASARGGHLAVTATESNRVLLAGKCVTLIKSSYLV